MINTNVDAQSYSHRLCQFLVKSYGLNIDDYDLPIVILTNGTGDEYSGQYHYGENLIEAENLGRVVGLEYARYAKSPVIGTIWAHPQIILQCNIAHESVHWFQDMVMEEKGKWKSTHGTGFQEAYTLLRDKYINRQKGVLGIGKPAIERFNKVGFE
jgi:hypothetical protein